MVAKSDRLARDMFQPTHPHGVRRELRRTLPKLSWRFNPRTRTGCDFEESRDAITLLSFNPRTRTGCDDIETTGLKPYNKVSTHAPARGATVYAAAYEDAMEVSTHAPARGATCKCQALM